MENMKWYEECRKVPAEAKRPITGGRLKGFTDINPMWRIKKLTELFGACGDGWTEKNVDYQIIDGANGEKIVICEVEIAYRHPENDSICTVYGVGGSMLIVSEKNGLRSDDEAFKKAHTDAISVACKNLGMGADVYWNEDSTKYTRYEPEQPKEPKPTEPMYITEMMAKTLEQCLVNRGKSVSAFLKANNMKALTDMTILQFNTVMKQLGEQ